LRDCSGNSIETRLLEVGFLASGWILEKIAKYDSSISFKNCRSDDEQLYLVANYSHDFATREIVTSDRWKWSESMTFARRSTGGDRAKVIAIENESMPNPLFPNSILRNYEDLPMLKFTSLAIGILTAISIVPAAQARPVYDSTPVIIQQPSRSTSPQVIVVTPQTRNSDYHQGWTADRHRQWEAAREREARARWELAHSRHRQYGRYHNSYNDRDRYNEYRRDNNSYNDRSYHGEYRRDR
jgi:hypothetical protein